MLPPRNAFIHTTPESKLHVVLLHKMAAEDALYFLQDQITLKLVLLYLGPNKSPIQISLYHQPGLISNNSNFLFFERRSTQG